MIRNTNSMKPAGRTRIGILVGVTAIALLPAAIVMAQQNPNPYSDELDGSLNLPGESSTPTPAASAGLGIPNSGIPGGSDDALRMRGYGGMNAAAGSGMSAFTPADSYLEGRIAQGIFAEESQSDLTAAMTAYRDVIRRFDEQRAHAAHAIFRLAEVYRRTGRQSEAKALYARLLSEFPDQVNLSRMAHKHLFDVPEPVNGFGSMSSISTSTSTSGSTSMFTGGGGYGGGSASMLMDGGGYGSGFAGGEDEAAVGAPPPGLGSGGDGTANGSVPGGHATETTGSEPGDGTGTATAGLTADAPTRGYVFGGSGTSESREYFGTDAGAGTESPSDVPDSDDPVVDSAGDDTPSGRVKEQTVRRSPSRVQPISTGLQRLIDEHKRVSSRLERAEKELDRWEEMLRAVQQADPLYIPGEAGRDPRYGKLKNSYEQLMLDGDSIDGIDKLLAERKGEIERWVNQIYRRQLESETEFADRQVETLRKHRRALELRIRQEEAEAGTATQTR